MGGCTFNDVVSGENARDAFNTVTEQARWENGHGGYTGTIAEKRDFILMDVSDAKREELVKTGWVEWSPDDPLWARVGDKWGPAGCIDLKDGRFLFFGWASS